MEPLDDLRAWKMWTPLVRKLERAAIICGVLAMIWMLCRIVAEWITI